MALTYLDLTNRVRDKFNEPRLTAATWNNTVGFDQLTKDAINYSYHEILNAEMQWPFLHAFGIITTTPGVQLYDIMAGRFTLGSSILSGPDLLGLFDPTILKDIDWDSFYIASNENVITIGNEMHVIPMAAPYNISIAHIATWSMDLGVKYSNNIALTAVTGAPLQGQYSIARGVYSFNALDAGQSITISYDYNVQNTTAPNQINAEYIDYIDFDYWRQHYLMTDLNSQVQDYSKPAFVFKPQGFATFGISPVPDTVYTINFECWLDAPDMVLPTEFPVIPSRYEQVIIEGATKYCYEFREDQPLAQATDVRFKAGIYRMRIELINRDNTMQSGFYWYPQGYSYTSVTPV